MKVIMSPMNIIQSPMRFCSNCFLFNDTVTTEIYTYLHPLSLHVALPISRRRSGIWRRWRAIRSFSRLVPPAPAKRNWPLRLEEHTSELQSIMRNSYAVFCLKKKQKFNSDLSKITINLYDGIICLTQNKKLKLTSVSNTNSNTTQYT